MMRRNPGVLLLLLLLLAMLSACGSGEPNDAEEETEATVQSSPLVSAVDCTLRRETAYVDGQASGIDVITVGGKRVTLATGHAFLRMQRAADDAGVYLGLNSGFRTNAEQTYLYGCSISKSCNNGNPAAAPGYSNHQSGIAVDLTTSSWLAANAGRFGFYRTVPSEPWHYEYFGADPGGPCNGGLEWVSPRNGGWYTNGIWFKAKAPRAVRVVYEAGPYRLGESTNAADNFPVRYTFNQLGDRTVKATAYDASGARVGSSTTAFRVTQ